jgi:hypothetical protein
MMNKVTNRDAYRNILGHSLPSLLEPLDMIGTE